MFLVLAVIVGLLLIIAMEVAPARLANIFYGAILLIGIAFFLGVTTGGITLLAYLTRYLYSQRLTLATLLVLLICAIFVLQKAVVHARNFYRLCTSHEGRKKLLEQARRGVQNIPNSVKKEWQTRSSTKVTVVTGVAFLVIWLTVYIILVF